MAQRSGGMDRVTDILCRHSNISSTIPIPAPSVNLLLPTTSSLICASHNVYLIDPQAPGNATSFTGTERVQSVIPHHSTQSPFDLQSILTATESNSTMTVWDVKTQKIRNALVAGNDVGAIALSSDSTIDTSLVILAAVTKGAEVEIFTAPFSAHVGTVVENHTSPKALKKQARKAATQKSIAQIKGIVPGKAEQPVPIIGATFNGNELIVAFVHGGIDVSFRAMPWRDSESGKMLLAGVHEFSLSKNTGVELTAMNGVKNLGGLQMNDSNAVVSKGGNDVEADVMEIDHEAQEDSEESHSEAEDADEDLISTSRSPSPEDPAKALADALALPDTETGDLSADLNGGEVEEEAEEETEEPSFGDLLRKNAPQLVDIAAAVPDKPAHTLVPHGSRNLTLPSGMSLGTVLAQSLRTNDKELLESCFQVHNLDIVRATIERLDSVLAGSLLECLAERLHNRPGRAGSLMVWIQWTLVAHGGFLASHPSIAKRLRSLHKVVRERAMALQPLLSLKGKLDMLEAQLNLRNSMSIRNRALQARDQEDEAGVIYVEGQEESDSDEDEEVEDMDTEEPKSLRPGRQVAANEDIEFSDVDDEVDAMPTTAEMDEDEAELDESESEGLIDDEASVTSDNEEESDEELDDEMDYDDVDSVEEEGSVLEVPKPKSKDESKARLTNGISKKRK